MTARLSSRSSVRSPPSRHIPTYYVVGVWTHRVETRGDRSAKIGVKVKNRREPEVMGQKSGVGR